MSGGERERGLRLAAAIPATLVGMLLLAGEAAAQREPPIPPEQRCELYQREFDKVRKKKEGQPEFGRALRLRRLGEQLCNSGRTEKGQKVLAESLKAAGVKPLPYPTPSATQVIEAKEEKRRKAEEAKRKRM
ncbi:MAG: hypothetical protein JNK11_09180 [Alphaproteobacteria bacterium]|nr:hypothetical protein [Alphaproteobacteria bacterium]